jgi:hypothetical protein
MLDKIDKKQHDKNNMYHIWETTSNMQAMFIVHYFAVLLPRMYKISVQQCLPMTSTQPFHHTKTLMVLSSANLFGCMVRFFNHHAWMKGFSPLPVTKSNATLWQHLYATNEFMLWEDKKKYTWCMQLEQVAAVFAFCMNLSSDEVLSTYSSRFNKEDDPIEDKGNTAFCVLFQEIDHCGGGREGKCLCWIVSAQL